MTRTLLIILVLSSAVAACARDRQPAATKESAARSPASASTQALALLPAKNEVAGWAVSRPPRTFTADNLWELIDGAADGFVAYGVQEVVAATYAQAGTGYEAEIQIYRMKDPLHAYGKYSEERYPEYRFARLGNEGYSAGSSVNFWTGAYYVKITAFEERDAITREIEKLAQSIAAKVASPGAEPREVSFFPGENQLPHTTRYIAKDVLAQSYFTNGFEAQYKGGKKAAKLILIVTESDAAAQDALARYRQFVAKNGKDVGDFGAPGQGGFAGKDDFYGNVAAVRAGKHIAVALGFETEEVGKRQLAELVRSIR